jgi:hypothetical protein
MVTCGCRPRVTLIRYVERHILIYAWEFRPLQPTLRACLTVILIETGRKAAINSCYPSARDARELEDYLEAQLQRFAMVRINVDSYNVIVWVTSKFS